MLSLLVGSESGRAVSVRRCQGEGCRTCPATASGVVIEQMVVGGGRGWACMWAVVMTRGAEEGAERGRRRRR